MRASNKILLALLALAFVACAPADESDDASDLMIYGGKATAEGAWLTSVAIVMRSGGTNFCTGTLVHPQLVITAAHCFDNERLGTNNRLAIAIGNVASTGRRINVERGAIFPTYNNTTRTDIAYLKLQTPVTDIPLIPIATDPEEIAVLLKAGAASTLVGFGYNNQRKLGTKHEVVTKVTSNSPNLAIGGNGKDSCQGDSGGPAYGQLADGSWRVYGITSRGGECGQGGTYARMHDGICFIQKDSGITIPGSKVDCPGVTPIPAQKPAVLALGEQQPEVSGSYTLGIASSEQGVDKAALCLGGRDACMKTPKEDVVFSRMTAPSTAAAKHFFRSTKAVALADHPRMTILTFDAAGKVLQANEVEIQKK